MSGNYTFCNKILCTSSFDTSSGYLPPVEAGKGCGDLVCGLLHFNFGGTKNDLYMRRVALIRVDTTMGTICATAGFLEE